MAEHATTDVKPHSDVPSWEALGRYAHDAVPRTRCAALRAGCRCPRPAQKAGQRPNPDAVPPAHRNTKAGRLLWLMYAGDQAGGRGAGLTFSARNQRRFARAKTVGAGAPPLPLPSSSRPPPAPKPRVAVPRVGCSGGCGEDGSAGGGGAALPRRRPAGQILAELRAADKAAAAAPPPRPVRPLLGDAEKQRLALRMQHRGEPPALPGEQARGGSGGDLGGLGAAGCSRLMDTPRARLQAHFERLQREVEEREAWLAGMARDGLAKPAHAAVVRGDVAVRAKQMAALDEQLRALEATGGRGGGGCRGA